MTRWTNLGWDWDDKQYWRWHNGDCVLLYAYTPGGFGGLVGPISQLSRFPSLGPKLDEFPAEVLERQRIWAEESARKASTL